MICISFLQLYCKIYSSVSQILELYVAVYKVGMFRKVYKFCKVDLHGIKFEIMFSVFIHLIS